MTPPAGQEKTLLQSEHMQLAPGVQVPEVSHNGTVETGELDSVEQAAAINARAATRATRAAPRLGSARLIPTRITKP